MGGASIYYNNKNYVSVNAKGLLVDALSWNDLSGVSDKDNYTVKSHNITVKRMSFLARANYNYKNRYYFTFTPSFSLFTEIFPSNRTCCSMPVSTASPKRRSPDESKR